MNIFVPISVGYIQYFEITWVTKFDSKEWFIIGKYRLAHHKMETISIGGSPGDVSEEPVT